MAINAIMPFVQNEKVNAYELLAYQRIIGPINSDTLGYIENVLSWDGEEFVSTRMSSVIPGLLLNPPVVKITPDRWYLYGLIDNRKIMK